MKPGAPQIMVAALLLVGPAFGQSINLDHVDGLVDASSVGTQRAVWFHLRVSNPTDTNFDGIANGFRVYSPDGATWSATVHDTTGTLGLTQFDGGVFMPKFSADGQGADTVGFGTLRFFSTGMPGGFDDVAFTVTIGPIDNAHIGKTICLDSAFYPPSGVWKWAAAGGINAFPDWSGPHCYAIKGAPTGDSLIVSPLALEFHGVAGANIILSDSLLIGSNGAPLSYSVAVDSVPWLGISHFGGITPGTLAVSADAFNLGGGTYTSSITITSPQADNSPVHVPVLFRVRPTGPAVTLDHVDGALGFDNILTNEEVTFFLRYTGSEHSYDGLVNGFEVSSPTGARWTTSFLDTTGAIGMADFDLGIFFPKFSVDGMGADTLGFGAVRMVGAGMVPGFDQVALTLRIGPIESAYTGGSVCLDSTWFPPTGQWLWHIRQDGVASPAWDGPHCFTIANRPPSNLVVTPSELHFIKVQLEDDPPPQTILVTSSGPVSDDFTVFSDVNWLSAIAGAGRTPDSVVVMVQGDQMDVGDYTGHVILESPTAQNSPVIVPVHLTVEPGLTMQPFEITVHAATGTGLEDWTARFGVRAEAADGFDPQFDQFKAPPPPGDFVRVFFPHPEWNQFSDEFATDIRYLLQQECKEWRMVVQTNHATHVNLRCEFMADPHGYTISLFNELGTLLSEDFKRSGYDYITSGGETHFIVRVCDYPIFYSRYLSGWSLVSSPLTVRDPVPSAVFGDDVSFFQLYGWNGAYYAPHQFVGRTTGYWLLLPQAATVDYEGVAFQPADSVVCADLRRGWNLIGCPFDHPIGLDGVTIDSAGHRRPFYEAAAAGWISPVFYAWSGSFYFMTPEFRPGYGYWFAALLPGLQLCLSDAPTTAIAGREPDRGPTSALYGDVTIVTLSRGSSSVSIGLADDANDEFDPRYDLPAPPGSPAGAEQTLLLLADHPDGFGKYLQDIRGLDKVVTWTLRVVGSGDDGVGFGGLTGLAALGYQLEVVGLDCEFRLMVESDGKIAMLAGEYQLLASRLGEPSGLLPERCYLAANYPNPFNPRTTITYGLPAPAHVRLTVYNILGQEVATLIDGPRSAGHHQEDWNGCDNRNQPVSSGVYLYRLETGQFSQTRKMMLVK